MLGPFIKQMPLPGLMGLGGGATSLVHGGAVQYDVDFLVIAGGGAGAGAFGGGGGAGGYRASYNSETSGGGGSSESAQTVVGGTQYQILVGAGGHVSGQIGQTTPEYGFGEPSSFADIESLGGGGGGVANSPVGPTVYGGSGGGRGRYAGEGNLGTTNQGYPGGDNTEVGEDRTGAGGGGAGSAGQADYSCPQPSGACAGNGGNGVVSTITASPVTRAGGGGGGTRNFHAYDGAGSGGPGGGGNAAPTAGNAIGQAGQTNTGSGSGAGAYHYQNGYWPSGVGGPGVVILRMPTANYSGITTGSPSVSTSGSDTIVVYNSSGSYTA